MLVNTKSKKQRNASKSLSKERRSVSTNTSGSNTKYHKSIFSKTLTNRYSTQKSHGKYKNAVTRLSRNAVHTITRGVLEFAQQPVNADELNSLDISILENEQDNQKIVPRFIKVCIENLSGYSPRRGESVAGMKSQWTRGLFQDLIMEKAVRDGIYVEKVSAAYTTVRHYEGSELGEKGFVIVKASGKYFIVDGLNKLTTPEEIEVIAKDINEQSQASKFIKSVDYFWTRRISQVRLGKMFYEVGKNNNIIIKFVPDSRCFWTRRISQVRLGKMFNEVGKNNNGIIKFVPDSRGNMLKFEIKVRNSSKIQFIGRDLNAPINIGKYNKALHYLYALQINTIG